MKSNAIYCGDCLEIMAGWPQGGVDLVFADPPYNIGYLYDRYDDDQPAERYVKWCRDWMAACRRVLKPHGSFYLAIGDDFAAELCLVGKQLGFHLRNWIIWHYTFGQNCRTKFSRAHTHILYFTKDARRLTFNDHLLRFPSARHTEYQDLRANPQGRVPDDVWDEFPRVCGTFRERDGMHGCQMPEALLTRIILASSNPGDVVLDPLVGTGTTVAVAKRLGRRYVGIDISADYVQRTRERLKAVRDESKARPTNGAWPALHDEFLMQLYRETGVALNNLLPNDVALRVIAASLSRRAGHEYTLSQVRERLTALGEQGPLPKLPNDREFVPRDHRTNEGKRYVRRVFRCKTRRRSRSNAPELRLANAQSAG